MGCFSGAEHLLSMRKALGSILRRQVRRGEGEAGEGKRGCAEEMKEGERLMLRGATENGKETDIGENFLCNTRIRLDQI